jgi:hypothetical protein
MTSPLQLVSQQFPLLQGRVTWRFEHDELFRELCQDYEACVEASTRLEATKDGPEALRREYVALRLRLETELLRYLQETDDPGLH